MSYLYVLCHLRVRCFKSWLAVRNGASTVRFIGHLYPLRLENSSACRVVAYCEHCKMWLDIWSVFSIRCVIYSMCELHNRWSVSSSLRCWLVCSVVERLLYMWDVLDSVAQIILCIFLFCVNFSHIVPVSAFDQYIIDLKSAYWTFHDSVGRCVSLSPRILTLPGLGIVRY